jgi:hypothetical protein
MLLLNIPAAACSSLPISSLKRLNALALVRHERRALIF